MAKAVKTRATDYDRHVAERLKAARKLAGLSQTDAGASLGLTFQQVQKYEKGANRISAGRLFQLAEAYGLPIEWFFDGLNRWHPTIGADLSIKLIAAPHGANLTRDFLAIDSIGQQAVANVAAAFATRR